MTRSFYILLFLLIIINMAEILSAQDYDGICGIENLSTADSLYAEGLRLADSGRYDIAAIYFSKASQKYDSGKFMLKYIRARKKAGWAYIVTNVDSTYRIHDELYKFCIENIDTSNFEELRELGFVEYYKARNCRLQLKYDSSIYYSNLCLERMRSYNDSISNLVKFFHNKNLGNTFQHLGDFSKAINYNKNSLQYISNKDILNLAKVLTNLGYLYGYEDNFDYGIMFFKLAAQLWDNINFECRTIATKCYTEIAFYYSYLGNFDALKSNYDFLIRRYEKGLYDDRTDNIEANLDELKALKYYASGFADSSKSYLMKIINSLDGFSIKDSFFLATSYYNIGKSYYFKNEIDSALNYFFEAQKYYNPKSIYGYKRYIEYYISLCYSEAGRYNESNQLLFQILFSSEKNNKNHYLILNIKTDLSEVLLRISQNFFSIYQKTHQLVFLDSALKYAYKSYDALIDFLKNIISVYSNYNYLKFSKQILDNIIDILIERTRAHSIDNKYEILKYTLIEKELSNFFLVSFNQFNNESQIIEFFFDKLIVNESYEVNNFIKDYQIANYVKAFLIYDVAQKNQLDSSFHWNVRNTLSFDWLPKLSQEEVVIDYYLGKNNLVINCFHKDNFEQIVIKKPGKVILDGIVSFNKSIIMHQLEMQDSLSILLYKYFLDSCWNLIRDALTIIFIYDGNMFDFQFELIKDPSNNKYLIENHNIINLSSLSELRKTRIMNPIKLIPNCFIGISVQNSLLSKNKNNFLEGAVNEIRDISVIYESYGINSKIIFLDTSDSIDWNILIKENSIIHLAMHYNINFNNDLRSFFYISNDNLENQKQLSHATFLKNKYRNQLVVLNSCASLKGNKYYEDKMSSVAFSIYKKGARNVLATLWNTPDSFAHKFMVDFYIELLKNDHNVSVSLRNVKNNYIDKNIAPSLWGAYKIFGI